MSVAAADNSLLDAELELAASLDRRLPKSDSVPERSGYLDVSNEFQFRHGLRLTIACISERCLTPGPEIAVPGRGFTFSLQGLSPRTMPNRMARQRQRQRHTLPEELHQRALVTMSFLALPARPGCWVC
jgi:hypothetical protein